jgi:hypothetical protein
LTPLGDLFTIREILKNLRFFNSKFFASANPKHLNALPSPCAPLELVLFF